MIDSALKTQLLGAEYTLLRYQLRFTEDLLLPPYALLRLRREFSRVMRGDLSGGRVPADFRELLRPSLPTDPALLRRVQQPAPGFVLQIDQLQQQKFASEDCLELNVCFLGRGMLQVEIFSRLLAALGEIGLCGSSGRFMLEKIESCNSGMETEPLWCGGPFGLTPQIFDLSSVLDSVAPSAIDFEFLSPARLIKNQRPLFRSGFAEVLPFILRRVTGMLAVWADLEDVFDPRFLLDCSRSLQETEARFDWQDWRPLHSREEAGGLLGSVTLSGAGLVELWPLLKVGELFGIGKGAAFGAGRYRLV